MVHSDLSNPTGKAKQRSWVLLCPCHAYSTGRGRKRGQKVLPALASPSWWVLGNPVHSSDKLEWSLSAGPSPWPRLMQLLSSRGTREAEPMRRQCPQEIIKWTCLYLTVPFSGNWRSNKTGQGFSVQWGSLAHNFINKALGVVGSLGFLEKRWILKVTDMTGQGVWITNLGHDLGCSGCCGSQVFAWGHRLSSPCPAIHGGEARSVDWRAVLPAKCGLYHYWMHHYWELAGKCTERALPSQSES